MSLRDRLERLERGPDVPPRGLVVIYDPLNGEPLPDRLRPAIPEPEPEEQPQVQFWLPRNGRDP